MKMKPMGARRGSPSSGCKQARALLFILLVLLATAAQDASAARTGPWAGAGGSGHAGPRAARLLTGPGGGASCCTYDGNTVGNSCCP